MIETAQLLASLLGAAIILCLVRLEQRFSRQYWTMSQLVFEYDVVEPTTLALARRFAYPFAVGAIAAASVDAGWQVGAAAGGTAAFLIVWPPLFNPALLPFGSSGREPLLRLLYVLFCSAYLLAGGLGGALADVLRRAANVTANATQSQLAQELAKEVLGGLVLLVVVALAQSVRRRYHRAIERRAMEIRASDE